MEASIVGHHRQAAALYNSRFVQLYSTLCTSMNDDDGAHVMVHLLHDCLPCRHACLTTLHPRLWQPHIPDLGDTTQTLRNLEYNVYIHEQWPWYTCYMIAHLLPAWELYIPDLANPTSQTLPTPHPRPCQPHIPDLGNPTSQTLATLHYNSNL